MKSLLILEKSARVYQAALSKKDLGDLQIHIAEHPNNVPCDISTIDLILGRPDYISKIIQQARNVKWVQSTFAGVDKLCDSGLRRDYILTGVKEIFGPLMSEFVFAYILAFERQLFNVRQNQSAKIWKEFSYRSLSELTIGIAGLGSIGQHLAKTAKHFGMNVLGLKRTSEKIPAVEKVYSVENIDAFLPELDYLVLVLPETPDSKHLIQKEHFILMKESAIVMNVGRGSAIKTGDLIWAMKQKQIGGAVLDVFEEEPLPKTSPLWELPNVYISPHIAATSFPHQIIEIFYSNYLRYIENAPLNYAVDFNRGY